MEAQIKINGHVYDYVDLEPLMSKKLDKHDSSCRYCDLHEKCWATQCDTICEAVLGTDEATNHPFWGWKEQKFEPKISASV